VLLLARLIQGLGGGALLSLSYIATYEWFEERLWNRVFGAVAAIWGAGSLLGPLIGGLFAQHHAWRSAFLTFAALGVGLSLLIAVLLPRSNAGADKAGRWPVWTIGLLSVGTLLIAEAGIARGRLASTLLCIVGVAFLYAAARRDRSTADHLLPRELLQPGTALGAGLMMIFALAVGTTGFWCYGPLILKTLFGIEPLLSGYILAAEAVAWSLGTVALSFRKGNDDAPLIRGGLLLVALGATGFAAAVPAGSLPALYACAAAQGLGFGICWPLLVTRCVQMATSEKTVASAAPSTLQRIGYAVGTAFAGVLANWTGVSEDLESHPGAVVWLFLGFVPILVVGLYFTWRFTSPEPAVAR
jgi:MFS family permease